MSIQVGIDVGGTFTDFLIAPSDAPARIHKTLSTPADPVDAVLDGFVELAAEEGRAGADLLGEVDLIVHGTTIATNAVLTGRGARTGLITTDGFRDILQIRAGLRERPYDNSYPVPEPLVPGQRRKEVAGRLRADGTEVTPLDEAQVLAAADELAAEGAEAIAICFMHSHAETAHEERAAELVRARLPEAYVTASHEITSVTRLYDRTSTAALNAYVGPLIDRYLGRLRRRLAEAGFGGVLLIMQSNGGVSSPEVVARTPAHTFLSGPASAPRAALEEIRALGADGCITADMGGTSFDACLISGGAPVVTSESAIGRWRLALPALEILTIGAGGGSIAWVDGGGGLHVGPQSAGAAPGPACYGFGGELPTVTDADLLLGYIDPAGFHGGRVRLDVEAARAAVEREIAVPLGVEVEEAAAGIYDLVCIAMAEGIREVSVKRGFDPREFPLVVAGGAGPLHAGAIAAGLEMPLVVIPRSSSIFCAAGMLAADFQHDFVRSWRVDLDHLDGSAIAATVAAIGADAKAILGAEGLAADQVELRLAINARYAGQWHDVTLTPPEPALGGDREWLADAFHRTHEQLYGYRSDEAIWLSSLRVTAVGHTGAPPEIAARGLAAGEAPPSRRAYLGRGLGFATIQPILGAALEVGEVVAGPTIVQEATTSVVVPPAHVLTADERGNFLIAPEDQAERRFGEAMAATAGLRR